MKVAEDLYHLRKQGSEKANILITFQSQEEAEAFSHPNFTRSVSVPLGDAEWVVSGPFSLESLEDLEAVESVLRVYQDVEFHIMPVGEPIVF